ncbi:hypothetical protein [Bartonella sp. AU18XJBT]|nr:hypothetical protein [Bartonella sp. AU18XJBT]
MEHFWGAWGLPVYFERFFVALYLANSRETSFLANGLSSHSNLLKLPP